MVARIELANAAASQFLHQPRGGARRDGRNQQVGMVVHQHMGMQ